MAVLQTPSRDSNESVVLIHGGVDDGGMPLGDTYQVTVSESADQPLEVAWRCVDDGEAAVRGGDGPAPWDQQQKPRARACHAAVMWDSGVQRCMVIFGGLSIGLEGELCALGDTWILPRHHADTCSADSWQRPVMQGGAPAKRWGHSCCLTGDCNTTGAMLVCGGIDTRGSALSDCWLLHLDEMRWELVETQAGLSPLRSLAPASLSVLPPKEEHREPVVGRCTVAWSSTLNAAVVWCGQGFWTCRLPESQLSAHTRQPRGELSFADSPRDYEGSSSPSRSLPASPVRRKELFPAPDAGRAAGLVHQSAPPSLPDVLPPPRHGRWAAAAPCSPCVPRNQSEPRLHESYESWQPLPPAMARGRGSQCNLLEPKTPMHGQMLIERPPPEAAPQWPAKHGRTRLEALAPL